LAEIHYLAEFPHYVPIVAFWNFREWHIGKQPFDEIIARYQARLQVNKIPTTLIAVEDTMPVGSVSLKENDLPQRPDLNPWLASLYVLADYRGRDIGRRLRGSARRTMRASAASTSLPTPPPASTRRRGGSFWSGS
jgi:predicted N-acetyltransferase YhbS